jgi:hypothetical protein
VVVQARLLYEQRYEFQPKVAIFSSIKGELQSHLEGIAKMSPPDCSDIPLVNTSENQAQHVADAGELMPTAPTTSSVQPTLISTTLDTFLFTQSPAPTLSTGSRRSGRILCPSARLIDPDNSAATSSTSKRKHSVDVPRDHQRRRKDVLEVTVVADGEMDTDITSDNPSSPNNSAASLPVNPPPPIGISDDSDSGNTDPEVVEVTMAYERTKALGDADRQVCFFCNYPIHIGLR